MEPRPITDGEIIDLLERAEAQKKFVLHTKYRSTDEEETSFVDVERYQRIFKPRRIGASLNKAK